MDENENSVEYSVDLPNPYDLEAPFIHIGVFKTKEEAVKYIRQFLTCDDEGNANLISILL
jgi:hypothetical protein